MSTPQQIAPQAPQITTTSPAGHTMPVPNSPSVHTANTPAQPTAATTAPTPDVPMITPLPTALTQVNPADPEPLTYNEKLNAADRLWKFKFGITTILIITGIIGIGCIAWAVSTAKELRSAYDYGYDSTWSLPWGLITFSISVLWCVLCLVLFLIRKCPVHPGARVAIDLLLWLAFIPTVLFTLVAFTDLLQWGEYQELGYSSRYGGYQLAKNNTWVWVQDSDYGTTYERSCNDSSSNSYSDYYYTSDSFKNCAEMDAYVNLLWHNKPNRVRTELTGVVCQFIGLVLHFALFVWACVDCHKHRRSKVSKDAEKIAAGIVEKMVQNGAVIPPPGQAHVRMSQGQPMYYCLPSDNGQPYPMQGQQVVYVQQMPGQVLGGQSMQQYAPMQQPPSAGPSNGKGVAGSYYEPAR